MVYDLDLKYILKELEKKCGFDKEITDEITKYFSSKDQNEIGNMVLLLIKKWAKKYKEGDYDSDNKDICYTSYNIVNMMNIAEDNEYWNNLPDI